MARVVFGCSIFLGEFPLFGFLLQVQLFIVHFFVDFLCGLLAQPETAEDLEHPPGDFLEPLEELLGPAAADAAAARDQQQQEEHGRESEEVSGEERAALRHSRLR